MAQEAHIAGLARTGLTNAGDRRSVTRHLTPQVRGTSIGVQGSGIRSRRLDQRIRQLPNLCASPDRRRLTRAFTVNAVRRYVRFTTTRGITNAGRNDRLRIEVDNNRGAGSTATVDS